MLTIVLIVLVVLLLTGAASATAEGDAETRSFRRATDERDIRLDISSSEY